MLLRHITGHMFKFMSLAKTKSLFSSVTLYVTCLCLFFFVLKSVYVYVCLTLSDYAMIYIYLYVNVALSQCVYVFVCSVDHVTLYLIQSMSPNLIFSHHITYTDRNSPCHYDRPEPTTSLRYITTFHVI